MLTPFSFAVTYSKLALPILQSLYFNGVELHDPSGIHMVGYVLTGNIDALYFLYLTGIDPNTELQIQSNPEKDIISLLQSPQVGDAFTMDLHKDEAFVRALNFAYLCGAGEDNACTLTIADYEACKAVMSKESIRFCVACKARACALKRCGCGLALYCSDNCEDADAHRHDPICTRALKRQTELTTKVCTSFAKPLMTSINTLLELIAEDKKHKV